MGKQKDPFADLPEEFRESTGNMDEKEIRERIAQVALDQAELMAAKALDQDLEEKRVAHSVAGEQYREGTKANRLKIAWCRQLLQDRGKL